MFGMEWRKAPGEAEAELAAMEMRGELDAIMTVSSRDRRQGEAS